MKYNGNSPGHWPNGVSDLGQHGNGKRVGKEEAKASDLVSRCGGGRSHKLLALFGLLCFASLLVLLALRAMLAVLY